MTKEEFIKTLEEKLLLINDEERKDILIEYEQHIQLKIESGLSEEQAIEDFGDMDELVNEILDAYHINTDYDNKANSKVGRHLSYYLQNAANFLTTLSVSLFEKSRQELGQILIKFIGLCAVIFALWLGTELVFGIFYSALGILPRFLRVPIRNIMDMVVSLFFLALTLYLFYFFICRYVLVNYKPLEFEGNVSRENHFDAQKTVNAVKEKTVDATNSLLEYIQERESHHRVKAHSYSLGNFCLSVLSFCIKCIAVLVLIPIALAVLCLAVGCGMLVVFVFKGFSIVGSLFLVLGLALMGAACFAGIYRSVFGGGSDR